MILWIDDIRPAPVGYVWCKSVNEAKQIIEKTSDIDLIDIDHDAGEFACDGGDYVKLLDWLEETDRKYRIHIHSMNPVGVDNMRRIIVRNGWTEI